MSPDVLRETWEGERMASCRLRIAPAKPMLIFASNANPRSRQSSHPASTRSILTNIRVQNPATRPHRTKQIIKLNYICIWAWIRIRRLVIFPDWSIADLNRPAPQGIESCANRRQFSVQRRQDYITHFINGDRIL